MKPLQQMMDKAARLKRKIVLSEGEDPRVIAAAVRCSACTGSGGCEGTEF